MRSSMGRMVSLWLGRTVSLIPTGRYKARFMEFKEAIRIALQSLWANKLRSILTLLGVVIGVASVIAVVTLVNGANVYVASKINKYGADTFTISKQPQIITSYDEYIRFQKRKNISMDDYLYVAE